MVLIALLISLTKSISWVNCSGAVPHTEDWVEQNVASVRSSAGGVFEDWAKETLLMDAMSRHSTIGRAKSFFMDSAKTLMR